MIENPQLNTVQRKFGSKMTREWFLELRKNHESDGAIARVLGISRQAVYVYRLRFDIAVIKNKNTIRNGEIYSRYSGGESGPDLCKAFKLSMSQIYRIVHKAEKKIHDQIERENPRIKSPVEKALENAI